MASSRLPLKRLAIALGMTVEDLADRVKLRYRERFHSEIPLHVVVYRDFGNSERIRVSGRVLAYRRQLDDGADTLWENLKASYRRFETDEVPGVRIVGDYHGRSAATLSDEEGYFNLSLDASGVLADSPSVQVALSVPDHPDAIIDEPAEITVPPPDAAFGVISDIDDTVLVTNATSIIRMMKLTLLQSSKTRLAFDGVAAFYAALHNSRNPFFYISSSPWNLYEFLDDFMSLNGIVKGPLLLRDYGIDRNKLIAGPHQDHKLGQIRRVLDCYPDLSFILIGDSGQDDPEIYQTIVEDYPGRILAVYIRDVAGAARDREVQQIIRALHQQGVDMLLVPDTLAAAIHAAAHGWIDNTALDPVKTAISRNQEPKPLLDAALDEVLSSERTSSSGDG